MELMLYSLFGILLVSALVFAFMVTRALRTGEVRFKSLAGEAREYMHYSTRKLDDIGTGIEELAQRIDFGLTPQVDLAFAYQAHSTTQAEPVDRQRVSTVLHRVGIDNPVLPKGTDKIVFAGVKTAYGPLTFVLEILRNWNSLHVASFAKSYESAPQEFPSDLLFLNSHFPFGHLETLYYGDERILSYSDVLDLKDGLSEASLDNVIKKHIFVHSKVVDLATHYGVSLSEVTLRRFNDLVTHGKRHKFAVALN